MICLSVQGTILGSKCDCLLLALRPSCEGFSEVGNRASVLTPGPQSGLSALLPSLALCLVLLGYSCHVQLGLDFLVSQSMVTEATQEPCGALMVPGMGGALEVCGMGLRCKFERGTG